MRKRIILYVMLTLLAVALAFGGYMFFTHNHAEHSDTHSVATAKYHCPMHPTYTSDKPGDCPICGMKLVLIKTDTVSDGTKAAKTPKDAKAAKYHCPMHPTYTSDKPGDCPICGMKLTLIKDDNSPTSDQPGSGSNGVPGRVVISLSPEKQQLIGLRSEVVVKRDLSQIIRTTATFEHDETRLTKISPRFGGWVRDLKVNFTGQTVEKGDPLLTVYSPDLLSAENEHLLAYQRFSRLKAQTNDTQIDTARRMADSSRRKLTLWQVDEEEIKAIEQTGQIKDEMLVRSPVSGHVISKTAVEGKSFMAGETLYEIGDMHHLWVRAYVYEYEAPLIKMGQKAKIILPYLGNQTYESAVTFLYPHIEQQTRRMEIRLEVDSRNHELRPGMWANVEIDASFGEALTIPASAVIDTGTRYVAFVLREDNHLEPREIKIGVKTDDYYEVREGVKEGEKVVTRALFLVDSESQLKSAISGITSGEEHKH